MSQRQFGVAAKGLPFGHLPPCGTNEFSLEAPLMCCAAHSPRASSHIIWPSCRPDDRPFGKIIRARGRAKRKRQPVITRRIQQTRTANHRNRVRIKTDRIHIAIADRRETSPREKKSTTVCHALHCQCPLFFKDKANVKLVNQ